MKKKIAFLALFFLFFSCGIDDILYLIPPRNQNDPSTHTDDSLKYFEFKTSDVDNTTNAAGYFRGFEIFYRIYENSSEGESEIAAANRYNDTNPSGAAEYLLSSLSFFSLKCKDVNSIPLIEAGTVDRIVTFRLIPYASSSAVLSIDSTDLGDVLRTTDMPFTSINKGDKDVKSSNQPDSSGELLVAVFAAAYGTDSAFRKAYSGIVFLGKIKIPKPW